MPLWKRIVSQVGLQPGNIVRESAPEHDICAVRLRLKLGGYDLQRKLYLLCVRPLSRLAGEQWSERVATHLRDLFSNSIYVHKDGKLYYLISRSDKQPVTDYEQTIWRECLYSSCLCGGLTGPFEDFGQM